MEMEQISEREVNITEADNLSVMKIIESEAVKEVQNFNTGKKNPQASTFKVMKVPS
jgi:hypothetical protein